MPIRWDEINPNKGSTLTRPREVYASLQGRKWPRLRPEQNEVLEAWYKRRTETDLVIKQNTGSGKTLTGLLIAQSSLHEGIGPAVFLVPDKFLIRQVMDEAADAKIAVTEDTKNESFLSSQAILVTTFYKLLNGRSTFGVRNVKQVIPLGTVIVDDAHAALNATAGLFTATVPNSCKAFDQMLKLFAADLETQSPKAYADIKAGEASAPIRIPPKAVADRASQIMDIVRPFSDDAKIDTLFFSWPFVADSLRFATITVTSNGIEIKTPCPEIALIPAFKQAERRIYLTATLEDEGVLVTELDAEPSAVRKPITPKQASDLGDRIILAPLSINPQFEDSAIHELARDFADGYRHGVGASITEPMNVVVLVPSDYAANRWAQVADETLHVNDMQPVIERMKNGENVGLVVLVNKYDGIDLPGDSCRLLIIDGVPTPLTPHERRASAALTGSSSFKARQVQRIEQGMGRGIRDVEDYCAVLVLNTNAALTLRDLHQRQFYSSATRAQVELSQQIADQIQGEGMDVISDLLNTFLDRESQWVTKSLEATADVTYDTEGNVSMIAAARREAFNMAVAGDFTSAVTVLRQPINSLEDDLTRGWYLEELATYQHFVDPVASQATLATARKSNPAVLRPAVSPPLNKNIAGPAIQEKTAAEYLKQKYGDAREMELSFSAIFDQIAWGVEHAADLAEEQIRILGLHLGFESVRPEKEDRDGGPDNLWALSKKKFAVIELKTDISRGDPVIEKREAAQLNNSITWLSNKYPEIPEVLPVLMHPSEKLGTETQLAGNTKIITEDDLQSLRLSVEAFARELAATGAWSDQKSVGQGLKRNQLTAEQIIECHSRKIRC